MAERDDFRGWDELIPDALGIVFSNLPLQEVLTVIPMVCKSWNKVVIGPYCWQEIDIEEWSSQWPDHLEELLQLLIMRSCGSLRKLCVSGLENDEIFSFIAEHAGSLQTLRIPRSEMSDMIVEQVAGKLSTITFLDVSYCTNIGTRALEAIGKHCKLLTWIRRNMHPLDVAEMISQDDEGHAIAATMPKLKHLEMAYLLVTTPTVLEIIASCHELELLDIRGCWNVQLDEKFVKENFPKLKVLGPIVVDEYDRNDWAACSDFSDSAYNQGWDEYYESSDEEWDDCSSTDEMHLRLVEGPGGDAWYVYDWPPYQ